MFHAFESRTLRVRPDASEQKSPNCNQKQSKANKLRTRWQQCAATTWMAIGFHEHAVYYFFFYRKTTHYEHFASVLFWFRCSDVWHFVSMGRWNRVYIPTGPGQLIPPMGSDDDDTEPGQDKAQTMDAKLAMWNVLIREVMFRHPCRVVFNCETATGMLMLLKSRVFNTVFRTVNTTGTTGKKINRHLLPVPTLSEDSVYYEFT